ncbi:hypothetical protein DPX16_1554 [Anabarilius grahami]|uniref:Uncharacterized protein n=1 Tax=Anabarilius grahami TaxID=495550 RepID=A0A3N0XUS3_ANAGA|nr:hypothetical protein DPX16_1554 [Anabarilius grahami]
MLLRCESLERRTILGSSKNLLVSKRLATRTAPLPASCTPAHVLIGHPFIRLLQRDFVRPLSGFDSSRVGGAARSLPVADVITLLIGHAADQLPVVFLVGTLKLKMSTTDQCFPVVE